MPSRVGIVVRTRHRPAFLRGALADIAAQTHTDRRIVVVDDGGDAAGGGRDAAEARTD